jgi:uncharacterized protein YjbI with pentapeptide repeats
MWDVVTLRPGKRPLHALAETFGTMPANASEFEVDAWLEKEASFLRGGEPTDLAGANLAPANLLRAILIQVNLFEANLSGANLSRADLSYLGEANLSGANLSAAALVETNLENAILTGCRIYGISAWNVKLSEGTKQQDLVITPPRRTSGHSR